MITEAQYYGGSEYRTSSGADIDVYSNSPKVQTINNTSAHDVVLPSESEMRNGDEFLIFNQSASSGNITVSPGGATVTPGQAGLATVLGGTWFIQIKDSGSANTANMSRTDIVDQTVARGSLTNEDCALNYAEWQLVACGDESDVLYSNDELGVYEGKVVILDGETICREVSLYKDNPLVDPASYVVTSKGPNCNSSICAVCPTAEEWDLIDPAVEYVVIFYNVKFYSCMNFLPGGAHKTSDDGFLGARHELNTSGSDYIEDALALWAYAYEQKVYGQAARSRNHLNTCDQPKEFRRDEQEIKYSPSTTTLSTTISLKRISDLAAGPVDIVFLNESVPAISSGESVVVNNEIIKDQDYEVAFEGSDLRATAGSGKALLCRRPAVVVECPSNAQWTANPTAEYYVRIVNPITTYSTGCLLDVEGEDYAWNEPVGGYADWYTGQDFYLTQNGGRYEWIGSSSLWGSYSPEAYEALSCDGTPTTDLAAPGDATVVLDWLGESGDTISIAGEDNVNFAYTPVAFVGVVYPNLLPGESQIVTNLGDGDFHNEPNTGTPGQMVGAMTGQGGTLLICRRPSGI